MKTTGYKYLQTVFYAVLALCVIWAPGIVADEIFGDMAGWITLAVWWAALLVMITISLEYKPRVY